MTKSSLKMYPGERLPSAEQMEMFVKRLPHLAIEINGKYGAAFADLEVFNFCDAVRYVWNLPYGRTSDPDQLTLVLREGRGTCSTKHALLAAVAEENNISVQLLLGFFHMSEANTPGVGGILDKYRLTSIPEAHCCLRMGSDLVDVTRLPENSTMPEPIVLYSCIPISPYHISVYKQALHCRAIADWVRGQPGLKYSSKQIWVIREACISALSL